MVGVCREHPSFKEIPEVPYAKVEGQKFLIESAVLSLCGAQLFAEKSQWQPFSMYALLQNRPYCLI